MLIVCPSCASSYVLDDARIGPAGRRVRCASCRETFFVAPADAEAAAFLPDQPAPQEAEAVHDVAYVDVAGEVPPEMGSPPPEADSLWNEPAQAEDDPAEAEAPVQDAVAEADAALDEALEAQWREEEAAGPKGAIAEHWPDKPAVPRDLAAEPAETGPAAAMQPGRAGRKGRKQGTVTGRRQNKLGAAAVLALCFLPALAGLFLGRAQVVRLLPETAALYAVIGLPVNLRGLEFERVRGELVREGNARLLVVEGEIVNPGETSLAVPPIALGVLGEGATPLYRWTTEPERATLAGGERVRFRARLVSPPQEGRQVLVRFAGPQDAGLAPARAGAEDARLSGADMPPRN